MFIAHFKCKDPRKGMEHSGCGHEWHSEVGPAKCPKCRDKQDYITWTNYKETIPMHCTPCEINFKSK